MSKKAKKVPFLVLGREIGVATGWDMTDTFEIFLYDFEPSEGVDLPEGDIAFNSETGHFLQYDDKGETIVRLDAVRNLINVPRKNNE